MKALQREINELIEARDCKNSQVFQEFFVKPIYAEIEKLGKAYDCQTTEEIAELRGKHKAHQFFIGLLKGIDEDIRIKTEQLKSDEE